MRDEHENHIPIYINRIQFLELKVSNIPRKENNKKLALLDEILALSRTALEKINQNDLLRYVGEKHHDALLDDAKKLIYFNY